MGLGLGWGYGWGVEDLGDPPLAQVPRAGVRVLGEGRRAEERRVFAHAQPRRRKWQGHDRRAVRPNPNPNPKPSPNRQWQGHDRRAVRPKTPDRGPNPNPNPYPYPNPGPTRHHKPGGSSPSPSPSPRPSPWPSPWPSPCPSSSPSPNQVLARALKHAAAPPAFRGTALKLGQLHAAAARLEARRLKPEP